MKIYLGECASDILKSSFPSELRKLSSDIFYSSDYTNEEKVGLFLHSLQERERTKFDQKNIKLCVHSFRV